MADQTKSISNTLSFFGPEPAYYNTAVYGTDTYGDTNDLDVQIGKVLSNSITPDTDIFKNLSIVRTNSLSFIGDWTTSELVGDGSGWFYNFPPKNAENRSLTSWTQQTEEDSTWSPVSSPDYDWDET
jgi:hypothetical protein